MLVVLNVVYVLIAIAMIALILMQRGAGAAAGSGFGAGASATVFGATGAGNFLSKSTKWLAIIFVVLAIVMAAVAVDATSDREIDDSLDRTVVPAAGTQPEVAPAQPAEDDPLADVAQ